MRKREKRRARGVPAPGRPPRVTLWVEGWGLWVPRLADGAEKAASSKRQIAQLPCRSAGRLWTATDGQSPAEDHTTRLMGDGH